MRAGLSWILALALPWPAVAATGMQVVGGGESPVPRHAPFSPQLEAQWAQETQQALAKFGRAPPLAGEKAETGLAWPIGLRPGTAGDGRTGIANFVDLDAGFPDKLRDYMCNKRTYDTTAGYNHGGADIFIWPFGWQSMSQGALEVRAAAAGTLVAKHDGEYDRNCSFDSPNTPNYAIVAHDDGTSARYLHLKKGSVTDTAVGTRIPAGAALGLIGSSGISTGPHLHFELRGANNEVIEPHSGQCNGVASRWNEQRPYREPRLVLVGVHSAAPQVFPNECARVEKPNHARLFKPGDTVYIGGYYADQPAGKVSTIVLRRPDGSEQAHYTHAPTTVQLNGKDAFNASTWIFSAPLPANAPAGRWQAEISYEGRTLVQPFAVGGPVYGASGLWYDPAQTGQGFTLETVDVGGTLNLVAAWFTYVDGAPRWIHGIAPITGNGATIAAMISKGGDFPPAFEPGSVQVEPWGTLTFTFTDANTGSVAWSSSQPGFGNGAMPLTRLVALADVNLDDFDTGLPACMSGTWYDPTKSGHGLLLQVASLGGQRRLLASWYAFDDGKQVWLSGNGAIDGQSAEVPLVASRGGRFPPAFNPADVVHEPWGTARFERIDSHHLRLSWQATAEGFDNGELLLQRLTGPLTAHCL